MSHRLVRPVPNLDFDVRASSSDYATSVHRFDLDERYSLAEYRRAILSGYLSSVSTMSGVAAECGLAIDTETFERWKRVAAAAGLIDDFLDNSEDIAQANRLYQAVIPTIGNTEQHSQPILQSAGSKLDVSIGLLGNSVKVLSQEQKQRSTAAASAIGNIAVNKSLCEDTDTYIDILKEEGLRTKDLVVSLASASVQEQPGFETFDDWCEQALVAATLADSSRDLWADKLAGRTSVAATAINSLKIALAASNPGYKLIRSRELRNATFAGIAARSTFSKLPTNMAMRRRYTGPEM